MMHCMFTRGRACPGASVNTLEHLCVLCYDALPVHRLHMWLPLACLGADAKPQAETFTVLQAAPDHEHDDAGACIIVAKFIYVSITYVHPSMPVFKVDGVLCSDALAGPAPLAPPLQPPPPAVAAAAQPRQIFWVPVPPQEESEEVGVAVCWLW